MSAKPKLRKTLFLITILITALLLLPFALPLLLPFLIGLGVALLAEPLVRMLQTKTRLPRWLCAILCVGTILLLLGTGLYFLARALLNELTELSQQLPELLAQLEAPIAQLRAWLEALAARLPERTAQAFRAQIAELFSGSSYLMQSLSQGLVGFVTGLLSGMPKVLISTVTTLLASFFISASLPELRQTVRKKLTDGKFEQLTAFTCRMKKTLGCWLLAQAELAGISAVALCIGLAVLRVDFWLLLGLLIALIDALPVLGAGIVLIPWALIAFLQENSALGIGLLILYGCVSLLRSALEPKLVGQKVGLHPLASLAAFYAGFRLMGAAGMVLFPIGTVLTRQVYTLLKPDTNRELHGSTAPEKAR